MCLIQVIKQPKNASGRLETNLTKTSINAIGGGLMKIFVMQKIDIFFLPTPFISTLSDRGGLGLLPYMHKIIYKR